MENSWFKNAIFYSLDVETYYDSNGDGIGDFQGLISKLDYIASLGINCIWLLPFYPSPNRDNGYDVMDYYNVDARLGTLGDFSEFMYKAEAYGIRVLIDLVVNHTSIQHPWFQEARKNRDSPYRDYYVWSDKALAFEQERLMLRGEVDTVWTFDEAAGQYYLHRFYKEQPDLNLTNPKVREEILRIMGFWLQLGVAGFRIDAAEFLIETYGIQHNEKHDLERFINEMRNFIALKKSDAVLLAEVNAPPEEMKIFLGNGDRMNMLFNFYINQYLFLSLAMNDPMPLMRALQLLPGINQQNQWLNFLRHHDELSLKNLNQSDQQVVFDAFAPEENMRIYGRGIRRRISPMMNGDINKMKFAFSLLFSLPGVPLIRYGDEICMGDDLNLPGRTSVRTPMQWSPQANGGFSTANYEQLVHPVIKEGEYSYESKNVIQSQYTASSFLNWLQHLINTRKQCYEIASGQLELKESGQPEIMVHSFSVNNSQLVFIHNFSSKTFSMNEIMECIGNLKLFPLIDEIEPEDELETIKPYGYRWYRVAN